MRSFQFSKLVRDKIVSQQQDSGAVSHYRTLSKDEHKHELVKKIIEEVKEVTEATKEDVASEIADVQQALDDLKAIYGIDSAELSREQARKNEKAGAFSQGLFVEYVEVDDENPWVDYYLKNADRYPEIKEARNR